MKNLVAILLLIQAILGEETAQFPTVTTPLGVLEGRVLLGSDNKSFFAFESVPYAEPPTGNLRFEEPVPKRPWKGTREAKNITKCLQYSQLKRNPENDKYLVDGEEDCLFVNVYTQTLNPEANLDVLVYIHGGAFMFGSAANYGPNTDIVYVNLNYRLGPLGFLSTEDSIIPGNNGLRDQTLALKFVKENIKYFGGNPDSITIWGLSAGGASVHLHYMMPQSKGLFKQGISTSGCALNPWVLVEKPLEKAKKLANHLGCSTKSSTQIKNCLKSKSGNDIVQSVEILQPWLYNPFSPLGVVVDTWAKEPVLHDHPYNLLKHGKVLDLPWIISYTTEEGLYPAAEFYSNVKYLSDIDEQWNEIIPFILHFNDTVNPNIRDKISQKIRHFYMEDLPVNKQTFSKLVQAISDRLFVADIETAARMHNVVVKSNVYVYVFGYRGVYSNSEFWSKTTDNIGVSHADDTIYAASRRRTTLFSENDRRMIQIFETMFLSFMKTGKPQIIDKWLPLVKSRSAKFLQLKISSPDRIQLEKRTEVGHRRFWHSLPFEEKSSFIISHKKQILSF